MKVQNIRCKNDKWFHENKQAREIEQESGTLMQILETEEDTHSTLL